METYVGEIKVSSKNGYYVNFYPGYRLVGDEFVYLSQSDIRRLLPESQYLNINLVSTSPSFSLEDLFQDGDDILLDFSFDDLQPNLKADGFRYPTAWKLDVSRNFGSTVRRMEDLGLYYVLDREAIEGDWKTDRCLWIDSPNVNEGMEILIPIEESNVLIGPYKVRYDEDRDLFFVWPNPEKTNHLIHGYEYANGIPSHYVVLDQEDVTRSYAPIVGDNITPYAYDLISLEDLIDNFKETMKRRMSNKYRFDEQAASSMISVYTNSLLSGGTVSKEVAKARARKLEDVLSSTERFDATLDQIGKLVGSLLLNFQDQQVYASVIRALSEDEDFLDQIGTFREFAALETKYKSELNTLSRQKAALTEQVAELERLNPARRLEEYNNQIAHLEQVRQSSEQRLQEILRTTGLASNLADLERQSEYLEAENSRKLQQSNQLSMRLEGLQEQLDSILANSARKVLEMTFDNLISERFLEQTARSQQRQMKEEYAMAAKAIATLPVSTLDAAQTILQLKHSFRQRRPEYTDNEILNVLICLSQSFLTIFTGRPGSGKTSLNEITADVLSLCQPEALRLNHPDFPYCGRFVSISVERGWTSRRDLIGFYNSLTRTFDKASPELFDLLSILDMESRSPHQEKMLPALVLLDDANLSSMEYYWADFMAMDQDDPGLVRGTLNLGEGYRLAIPQALHFAATIQNDHTTEPISSRLLDRAFVISMPEHNITLDAGLIQAAAGSVLEEQLFTFDQLQEAFEPLETTLDLPESLEALFRQAQTLFTQAGVPVSIRSQLAMRRYILSGARWFEAESELRPGALVALDYAILQRMMPSLNGTSERFRQLLAEMLDFFKENNLSLCQAKLEEIMEKGDDSMQYYQFF